MGSLFWSALILVVVGMLLGVFVPVGALQVVTIVVLVAVVLMVVLLNRGARGTSGALGGMALAFGAGFSFLVPAWIAWLIRMYGPR